MAMLLVSYVLAGMGLLVGIGIIIAGFRLYDKIRQKSEYRVYQLLGCIVVGFLLTRGSLEFLLPQLLGENNALSWIIIELGMTLPWVLFFHRLIVRRSSTPNQNQEDESKGSSSSGVSQLQE